MRLILMILIAVFAWEPATSRFFRSDMGQSVIAVQSDTWVAGAAGAEFVWPVLFFAGCYAAAGLVMWLAISLIGGIGYLRVSRH